MKIQQVENPAVEVHDLTVSYQRRPVLWAVDFTLPSGALAGIIGPNGAGKSTLIKAIMGLVPISSGYVKITNQSLDEVRKQVCYVPQRESVDWDFPASVLDIVLMGRYAQMGLFKPVKKRDKEFAMLCLQKVGMDGFYKRQIAQLSGGQQQRVFLARALAQEALIYFMDEPFAGVDASTESAIIAILKDMRSEGKTIVVVHHDLQSVPDYFNWVVMLNTRLVASGPTEDVFNTATLQETYGGKLSVLAEVGELLKKQQFPNRE
jgi:manganese/zinc/iron transport system ATP- binding protein